MQRGGGGYLGHCGSTWGVLRLFTAGGVGGTLLFLEWSGGWTLVTCKGILVVDMIACSLLACENLRISIGTEQGGHL